MKSRDKKQKQDRKKKRDQKKRAKSMTLGLPNRELPDNGAVLLMSPPGAEKMSDVIMEFLKPYSEHWRTVDELEKLLAMGVIAWNAALSTGSKRDELLKSVAETMPPEARADFWVIIEEMIRRKITHFASNQRLIIDYRIDMLPSGHPYVSVVSTLVGEDAILPLLEKQEKQSKKNPWWRLFG